MVENVLAVLGKGLPDEWAAGMIWYRLAYEHAERIAGIARVSIDLAAAEIAVLSPRTSWPRNLAAAQRIAQHYAAGGTQATFDRAGLVCLPANIYKAFAILGGNIGVLSGQKVVSFYDNILHYRTSGSVTVDAWAYRIAHGMIGVCDEIGKNITEKRYNEVAAAYQEVAIQRGLLPSEVQAITWVIAHRLEGKAL